MSGRGFKRAAPAVTEQAVNPPGEPEGRHSPHEAHRDPAIALAAAAVVAPTLPPTRVAPSPPEDPVGQLNLKVRVSLIDQLAEVANREGTTQKALVCRALAAAGYRVHPDDLDDRGNHRRRRRA